MKLNLLYLTDEAKLLDWARKLVDRIHEIVDGGKMGFGDIETLTTDNVKGVWYTYTTNATHDTEDAITHNLGVVPQGWLVFYKNKAGDLYDSGTPWTTTQMFLKCSTSGVKVTLFILPASNRQY